MRAHIGAAVGLALLAGCEDPDFGREAVPETEAAGIEEAIGSLSEAEIRVFLADSTLIHRTEAQQWIVYVGEGGRLQGLVETRGRDVASAQASGTWSVTEDGLFCREWADPWDPGDTGCARVRREGATYLFIPRDGETEDGLRKLRKPGNLRGL